MTIWLDAQLSPAIALRDLGLRDATDREIFFEARASDAIVMTKDSDFVRLLEEHGAPPKSYG